MAGGTNKHSMEGVTWQQVLGGPCFVLNMDRSADRLAVAMERVRAAGFTGRVERVRGLDKDQDDLGAEWARLGGPRFQDRDGFPENHGKQACALGHYGIWRRMLEEGVEYAVVFEDDVLFHKHWAELAPWMYENTPKDFDILYMGSSFDVVSGDPVLRAPVFCTHAMLVTRKGAQKGLEICLNDPKGTWTIDWMLREDMQSASPRLRWYLWNGMPWHDERAFTSRRWQENIKNKGLVFQDPAMGSFVDLEASR